MSRPPSWLELLVDPRHLDQLPHRCTGECKQIGLCSVDCTLAPWNQDAAYLTGPTARFKMLLRLRRWLKSPIDRRDITWIDSDRSWRWQPRSVHA